MIKGFWIIVNRKIGVKRIIFLEYFITEYCILIWMNMGNMNDGLGW